MLIINPKIKIKILETVRCDQWMNNHLDIKHKNFKCYYIDSSDLDLKAKKNYSLVLKKSDSEQSFI